MAWHTSICTGESTNKHWAPSIIGNALSAGVPYVAVVVGAPCVVVVAGPAVAVIVDTVGGAIVGGAIVVIHSGALQ